MPLFLLSLAPALVCVWTAFILGPLAGFCFSGVLAMVVAAKTKKLSSEEAVKYRVCFIALCTALLFNGGFLFVDLLYFSPSGVS